MGPTMLEEICFKIARYWPCTKTGWNLTISSVVPADSGYFVQCHTASCKTIYLSVWNCHIQYCGNSQFLVFSQKPFGTNKQFGQIIAKSIIVSFSTGKIICQTGNIQNPLLVIKYQPSTHRPWKPKSLAYPCLNQT